MIRTFKWAVFGLVILTGCKGPEKTTGTYAPPSSAAIPEPAIYRASNTRLHDILHHELRVNFDWDKRYLFGEATIDIKPYFYPSDELFLNARGMQINELSLISNGQKKPLTFRYENDSLKISLDRTYAASDTFRLFVDYIAKPDELKDPEGSAAITSDKGLYFINADGSEVNKPRQIWTQCETQAGSVWFPTIDSPNERFTQEIYMTVDTAMVTLSNGLLLSSISNVAEGTRTDYWKQSLPAAPYLTMMAVSDFRIVRDRWRGMEVNYYVDPEYEAYARNIFGNTPEMMEFFSDILGVDYPWEKYSQVVVHDYVSGAMENASATLHGEFLQRDARALLDQTNEDVISHELFHQWFGDLVTCESWSNIALNESFATYGEYLWNEYKYGRQEADYHGMRDLDAYLQQAKSNNAPLVRYDYEQQEDVFDRITYQKGGRILHMLRKELGDDAFFAGLKKYLSDNRFSTVEVHQLRLAMEEVSGRDLNWFFNQWFFNQGHPVLDIAYEYIDSLKVQAVTIEQQQDFSANPLFRIPLIIDIYTRQGVERHTVRCEHAREVLLFDVPEKPSLVNVDAEKMLVCTKDDHKSAGEWIYQFNHAPLFLDRYEALLAIGKKYRAGTPESELVRNALQDSLWAIRLQALNYAGTLARDEKAGPPLKDLLIAMARRDAKAAVREEALETLALYYKDPSLMEVYLSALSDSSYRVVARALNNVTELNTDKGLELAARYENDHNKNLRKIVYGVYSKYGSDNENNFMAGELAGEPGGGKYSATLQYTQFLTRCRPSTIEAGLRLVADVAREGDPWYVRMAGMQGLTELVSHCENKAKENTGDSALAGEFKRLQEKLEAEVKNIKDRETNPNLIRIYGRGH